MNSKELNVLNIDTSGEICTVSISQGEEVLWETSSSEPFNHSKLIAVFAEEAFSNSGIKKEQLKAVSVIEGPGSYTGLRIGAAFAKGLAYALDIPIIAHDALHLATDYFISENKLDKNINIFLPMLDARRMEVFTAGFDSDLNIIYGKNAVEINNSFVSELNIYKKKLIFGDGAKKLIEFELDNSWIIVNEPLKFTQMTTAKFNLLKYNICNTENFYTFIPNYYKKYFLK